MAIPKVGFFTNLTGDYRDLVTDQVPPGWNIVSESIDMEEDQQIELVKDADLILLWPGRVSDRVLQAAEKCRLIQLLSAGYDRMNLKLASDLGIPVANNGGANSVAVSEHTIMLILSLYRRLIHYSSYVKGQDSGPEANRRIDVFEFEGKTLGLIGIGNIAQKVANSARGFDVDIQYYDKYASISVSDETALGAKSVELDELLKTSDVVSIHVPLTSETYHMIGKRELDLMKPNALLVNTARGGIIDEEALIESLGKGGIAGAGLDVLENEPPSMDEPLRHMDNVIVTPHTAGPTLESLPKRAINSFHNMQRVWDGEEPLWTAKFDTPD